MACFLIVITTLVTVCVFTCCIAFKLVARSNARALHTRCQHLEQEQQQERRVNARLDLALEQHHIESRLCELLASLHRLGQVMRGSQQYDAELPARFHGLEQARFAYDRMALTLYAMALDHRVKLCDILPLEADIQHLWSQYLDVVAQEARRASLCSSSL